MKHADRVLHKLMELAGEDADLVTLADLALARLPYRKDEYMAFQLLLSILFHDDLAEAIAGALQQISPEPSEASTCQTSGQFVYTAGRLVYMPTRKG